MEYARVGDLLPSGDDCVYITDASMPTHIVTHKAYWQGFNTLVIDMFVNGHKHSSMTFYGVTLDANLNSFVAGKWHK